MFIPWNFKYSNTTMTHSTLKTWHGFTIFPNERTFAKMIHRSFVRHSMLRLRLYCSSERASSFCVVLVCAWCSYTYVTFSLTAAAREPTAFQGSQTGEGDSGQGENFPFSWLVAMTCTSLVETCSCLLCFGGRFSSGLGFVWWKWDKSDDICESERCDANDEKIDIYPR